MTVLLRLARRLPLWPVLGSCLSGVLRHALGVLIVGLALHAVLSAAAGSGGGALPVLGVLLGLSVLRAAARYLEQYLGHQVAFSALARLRLDYYESLIPQAPAVVAAQRSGDQLEAATRDIDRIETFYAHTLAPVVSAVAVLTGTATAVLLLGSGPAALLVALLLGAQLLLVPAIGARLLLAAAGKQGAVRARASALIADAVAARDDIVLAGAPARIQAQVSALDEEAAAAERRGARIQALRRGLSRALLLTGVLLPAVWPGALGLDQQTGLLVAGLFFAAHLPVAAVDGSLTALASAQAAAERYLERCDAPPAVPARPAPRPAPEPAKGSASGLPEGPLDVMLEDVRFGYPGQPGTRPVLNGLSFFLPAGARAAVTGGTGSGKSTIAALLTRTYDPEAGRVRIGGADLRGIPPERLRAEVVLVEQTPHIFAGTLLDNARLGSDAGEEEVAETLRALGLGALVGRGLGTRIGGQRQPVSGGQAQRIGLARALLKRPRVLILDEATSQLDAATQDLVMGVIESRLPETTIVHILHRTELLQRCTHHIALG